MAPPSPRKSITPLVDVLASASKHAIGIMRSGKGSTAPSPVPSTAVNGHALSPAQLKLNTLLKRQSELAALPAPTVEQDTEYAEIVQQISIVQVAINSEQQGAPHA
jgi:hypothetical protein